jgi:hypothetical protein
LLVKERVSMNSKMRFELPNCPDCGHRATGALEMIEAVAVLKFTSGDTAIYAGETVAREQYSLGRGPNQLELTCKSGHKWPSYLLDLDVVETLPTS